MAFRVDDGYLSPTAGSHHLLQVLEGILWGDAHRTCLHEHASSGFEFVAECAVHVAPSKQTHNFAIFNHGVTFEAVAPHQICNRFYRCIGRQGHRFFRHNLMHAYRGVNDFREVIDHLLNNMIPFEVCIGSFSVAIEVDEGGRSASMPASTKVAC